MGRRRRQQQLLRSMARWRAGCVRVHARCRARADAAREEASALLAQARASSAALERENAKVQAHVGHASREIGLLQRRMDERVGGAEAEASELQRQAAELQAHLEERTAQRQALAQASERASAELASLREQLDHGRLKRTLEEQQERDARLPP
jgi:chromosome segregation ATPase